MSVRERLKVTVCMVDCCAGLAAAIVVAAGVGVGEPRGGLPTTQTQAYCLVTT